MVKNTHTILKNASKKEGRMEGKEGKERKGGRKKKVTFYKK